MGLFSNKIKVSEAKLSKYIEGAIIDEDVLIEALNNGYAYIEKGKLEEYENKLVAHKSMKKNIKKCAELNNIGMKFEKDGNTSEAIVTYEKNIKEGCCPARHSFDRLMVIYRKNKDYKNELRVVARALEVFPEDNDYLKRFEKVNILLNK